MMRAVNYCRVSTDEETQANSLENQIAESIEAISRNGWIYVNSYVDEGKSATTIKHRDSYKKLVEDMEKNEFDIIVVKSQDRLMRNTREWYYFIDRLVQNRKKLYFYLENKFYSSDDALITGIRAILAEEFSRDLSKKINHAHKNRQKNGSTVLITSQTWGYDKDGKNVVINEKEAEIVRLIYTLCLQGYGSRSISKVLSNKGIESRTGKDFPEITIRRIIRNPLFKGTAIMNKKHMDFETKKIIYTSEDKWVIHKNIIPAIISEDVWTKANEIMDKRCSLKKTEEFKVKRKGKNIGAYDLSSKIYCGECGSIYWRRYRKTIKEIKIVEWSCSEYITRGRKKKDAIQGKKKVRIVSKGGCDNIHIKDDDLKDVLYEVSKEIYFYKKDEIIKNIMNILNQVFEENEETNLLEEEKERITKKRERLLDRHLDGNISLEIFKRKDEVLEKEYNNCCKNIEQKALKNNIILSKQERLCSIENEIQDISDKELCVHRLLEHIEKIEVFLEKLILYFDIFPKMEVKVEQVNYRKKKFSIY